MGGRRRNSSLFLSPRCRVPNRLPLLHLPWVHDPSLFLGLFWHPRISPNWLLVLPVPMGFCRCPKLFRPPPSISFPIRWRCWWSLLFVHFFWYRLLWTVYFSEWVYRPLILLPLCCWKPSVYCRLSLGSNFLWFVIVVLQLFVSRIEKISVHGNSSSNHRFDGKTRFLQFGATLRLGSFFRGCLSCCCKCVGNFFAAVWRNNKAM